MKVTRIKLRKVSVKTISSLNGGRQLRSQGVYCIPAVVAVIEVTIQTDVVAADIPLLSSRKSMKTAGIKIDLTSGTATIFGKSVMLNMTSSGHYNIPSSFKLLFLSFFVCHIYNHVL